MNPVHQQSTAFPYVATVFTPESFEAVSILYQVHLSQDK